MQHTFGGMFLFHQSQLFSVEFDWRNLLAAYRSGRLSLQRIPEFDGVLVQNIIYARTIAINIKSNLKYNK